MQAATAWAASALLSAAGSRRRTASAISRQGSLRHSGFRVPLSASIPHAEALAQPQLSMRKKPKTLTQMRDPSTLGCMALGAQVQSDHMGEGSRDSQGGAQSTRRVQTNDLIEWSWSHSSTRLS